MQYNPQLHIEFTELKKDGTEKPIDIEFAPVDNNNHEFNKPLHIQVGITKSLGGQQTSSITIHNTPIIEIIRNDYAKYLTEIRKLNWRVRIWAWYSNSDIDLGLPNIQVGGSITGITSYPLQPVFIGDIIDDFRISNSSVTDSSLQLTANSHSWLMNSGKLRKSFKKGRTYSSVVRSLFRYMNRKGYGNKSVIRDPSGELNKALNKSFSINRNPTEVMNDICREFDFVWGINNLIPYMLKRDYYFKGEYPIDADIPDITYLVDAKRGMTSLVGFSKYTFSLSGLLDNAMIIGGSYQVKEDPQINTLSSIAGRINEQSISLDNYMGHTVEMTLQQGIGEKVALPPKRDDSSGRSTN